MIPIPATSFRMSYFTKSLAGSMAFSQVWVLRREWSGPVYNTTASKDPLLCTLIIHCFPYPSYRSETASLTNHHRAVCLDLDKARRCVCNSGTVDKSGTVRGLIRFVVEPKMHGEKSFKSFGKFGKRGRRNKGGRFHHSGSKTMEVMQTYE